MSRILIWSPNYAPELIGISPLATDASEWLRARGHEIEVVTAMPNYPERRIHTDYRGAFWRSELRAGVPVRRSWLYLRPRESFVDKVLYELSFSMLSLPLVLRRLRRTDILVCVVPVLTAGALAAALVGWRRRPRLVLWVHDLVLSAALSLDGVGQRARRILRVAAAVEAATMRAADSIIVCSPGFRAYLARCGVDPGRVHAIYNWVDTCRIVPTETPRDGRPMRFLYAGNLGYTQGLETLVEATRTVPAPIEVEIVGDGNAAPNVRAIANHNQRISVRPPVAFEDFPDLLASADALVVVQRAVSSGTNLPSKIATYLASAKPVIGSLDLASSGAELLRESGGAILVPPEQPEQLANAMTRLAESPALRIELGSRGRAFAVANLERQTALSEFERAILG